jgi:hypothetical protein
LLDVLVLFMSERAEKQKRAAAILGELAELGLMLARELATQARATEDPEQQSTLAAAFQKTSRTVRLTLALDARLDREAARAAREAAEDDARRAQTQAQAQTPTQAAPVVPARRSPIEAHKDRVGNLLNRLIWNEAEGDAEDYEVLFDDLNTRLDWAAETPGFADTPVEVLARRVAADMGLSGELRFTACAPATAGDRSPRPADTG